MDQPLPALLPKGTWIMWFIETKGFRIGPDWYTEAGPFETEKDAEAYLADHHRALNPQGRKVRIHLSEDD